MAHLFAHHCINSRRYNKNGASLTVEVAVDHGPAHDLEAVELVLAALQVVLGDDVHGGDDDLVAGASLLEGLDEGPRDGGLPLVAGAHRVDQVLADVLQRASHL